MSLARSAMPSSTMRAPSLTSGCSSRSRISSSAMRPARRSPARARRPRSVPAPADRGCACAPRSGRSPCRPSARVGRSPTRRSRIGEKRSSAGSLRPLRISKPTSLPARSRTASGPIAKAEPLDDPIDLLGRGALLEQELGLEPVEAEHAVADETVAVAGEHRHLPEASGRVPSPWRSPSVRSAPPRTFSSSFMTLRGAEEVRADHRARPRGAGGDALDVERGGVGGQNRVAVRPPGRGARTPAASAPGPRTPPR